VDNPKVLQVRFYLGGKFVRGGNNAHDVGGDEAMSYIEKDKVSVPEITGHLKYHMIINDKDKIYLHWLFPGKELNNGLRILSDDNVCTYMSQCITESASRPLVNFGVLNDNLIKGLISCVK
jgi:hypothetical protein